MSTLLKLPSFGDAVRSAILVQWKASVGEPVSPGGILAEFTVDKATFELEAPAGGVLLARTAEAGDLVPAEGVVGVLGAPDEALPDGLEHIRYPRAEADACLLARATLDAPHGDGSPEPLNAMRRIIAERMVASKRAAPHFYVTTRIDMHACTKLRKRLKKERKRVTYNDMILKACALALKRFPRMASVHGPGGTLHRSRIDIGFAVSKDPDGLYVPVLRSVDTLSLHEIAQATKRMIEKVRTNRLLPEDFRGGVFTVSNLGNFDVHNFTAIINPGESAILAVGKIEEMPVVIDGEVRIRPMMQVTLSSDHRTIDGVQAARFNATVRTLLERADGLS